MLMCTDLYYIYIYIHTHTYTYVYAYICINDIFNFASAGLIQDPSPLLSHHGFDECIANHLGILNLSKFLFSLSLF